MLIFWPANEPNVLESRGTVNVFEVGPLVVIVHVFWREDGPHILSSLQCGNGVAERVTVKARLLVTDTMVAGRTRGARILGCRARLRAASARGARKEREEREKRRAE